MKTTQNPYEHKSNGGRTITTTTNCHEYSFCIKASSVFVINFTSRWKQEKHAHNKFINELRTNQRWVRNDTSTRTLNGNLFFGNNQIVTKQWLHNRASHSIIPIHTHTLAHKFGHMADAAANERCQCWRAWKKPIHYTANATTYF